MLEQSDQGFQKLLSVVYDAAMEEGRWGELYPALSLFFSGFQIRLICANDADGIVEKLTPHGLRQISSLSLEALQNPWQIFSIDAEPTTCAGAIIHDPEFLLLRETGLSVRPKAQQLKQSFCICGVRSLNDMGGLILAGLPHPAEKKEDVRALEKRFLLVFEHLAKALKIRDTLRLVESRARLQTEIATSYPTAMCIVDRQGRVWFKTQKLDDLLKSADALLTNDKGSLVLKVKNAGRQVLSRYVKEIVSGRCRRKSLHWRPNKRRHVMIKFEVQVRKIGISSEDIQLVNITFDENGGPPDEKLREVLKDLYDLTEAECRVACGLIRLGDMARVAAETKVTMNTVRSQMKSVFRKTGVHSQAALVSLILTQSIPDRYSAT